MATNQLAVLLTALLMLALCGAASADGSVTALPSGLTTIQGEAFQGEAPSAR